MFHLIGRSEVAGLVLLAFLVGGCGGSGSARTVFEGIRLPPRTEVVKRYGGDGAGQFVLAVSRPLTKSDLVFPKGFDDSTLEMHKTLDTVCTDESMEDGPRPSASCRATVVAVRRGPDPADPQDRYCRVQVDPWSDTQLRDGRTMQLARVGILCNRPRAELGP